MYEGFYSYDVFIDSIGDGFTIHLNACLGKKRGCLDNNEGYSALAAGFKGEISVAQLRAANGDQIEAIRQYLERWCETKWSTEQVVKCLRGALRQSIGNDDLDNYP